MPKGGTFIVRWPNIKELPTLKTLRDEYNALKKTFDYVKESAEKNPNNQFIKRTIDQLGNKLQVKLLNLELIEEKIWGSL